MCQASDEQVGSLNWFHVGVLAVVAWIGGVGCSERGTLGRSGNGSAHPRSEGWTAESELRSLDDEKARSLPHFRGTLDGWREFVGEVAIGAKTRDRSSEGREAAHRTLARVREQAALVQDSYLESLYPGLSTRWRQDLEPALRSISQDNVDYETWVAAFARAGAFFTWFDTIKFSFPARLLR